MHFEALRRRSKPENAKTGLVYRIDESSDFAHRKNSGIVLAHSKTHLRPKLRELAANHRNFDLAKASKTVFEAQTLRTFIESSGFRVGKNEDFGEEVRPISEGVLFTIFQVAIRNIQRPDQLALRRAFTGWGRGLGVLVSVESSRRLPTAPLELALPWGMSADEVGSGSMCRPPRRLCWSPEHDLTTR